jgi:transposase
MAKPTLTPEQKEQALKMLTDGGMKQVAVAKHFGVKEAVIHFLVKTNLPKKKKKERPLKRNAPGRPSKLTGEQREEALKMLAEGAAQTAVAKQFGVTRTAVQYWVMKSKSDG